ncbi:MAG: DNA polymerase III subunit gamma/tau [Candidatus Dojkabacteria bacterium]
MSSLYQKYRSSNFNEIKGQEHITKLLKNAVKGNQISHAYLFVGSRGTGKTSTARILAKAVNCLNLEKDGNPCGKCEFCMSISEGRFLDLIEIDAASNRGIDQIRELKEKIEFSPSQGRFKVYIIDEVHMLTTEAFNALLKTLEEPPEHVIFIFATTDVHKLPPTILSRCQRYDFRLGTDLEIKELVEEITKKEGIKIKGEALDIIVNNAKGSYRDALSILDVVYSGQEDSKQEITLEEVRKILGIPNKDQVLILLKNLLEGNGSRSLEVIEELEDSGVNLQQFTNYVLDVLREILIGKIKGKLEKEYDFTESVDIKDIHKLVNLFLEAENRIRYANNQPLVLEMIIPEMMKAGVNSEVQIVNRDVKNKIPSVEKAEVEEVESKSDEKCEDIPIDNIKSKWDAFITEIKPFNGHLYAFLGAANIVNFKDGVLFIDVPFKFHKERMEMPKSRNIISEIFKRVYGVNCKIECAVNEAIKTKGKSDAEFVLRNLPVVKKNEGKKEEDVNSFKRKKLGSEIEAMFDGV